MSEGLLEMITWRQLNYHQKPIGILNAGGFYDPLLGMFTHAQQLGFIREQHHHLYVVANEGEKLLSLMGF